MNNYNETTIERYLSNEMNTQEMQEFEKELLHNKEFANLFDEIRTAKNLIKEAGRIDLKNKLNTFEEGLSKKPKVISLIQRFARIAAVIIVLFGIRYLFNLNNSPSNSEIYTTNFEVYKGPITVRSSDNVETNWSKATDFYNNKSYDKALSLFQQSENNIPIYLKSFYLGICEMTKENPNYTTAISHFDIVFKSDNDYQQQANWYKALCYLKLDEKEKARIIFEVISKNENFNFLKAEKILDTL
jgi:tetratricopeptide (TPR) repeat protein